MTQVALIWLWFLLMSIESNWRECFSMMNFKIPGGGHVGLCTNCFSLRSSIHSEMVLVIFFSMKMLAKYWTEISKIEEDKL